MLRRMIVPLLVGTIASAASVDFNQSEIVIGKTDADLAYISTNECISPLYADWDGDGVKDLLCGYWKGAKGFVRFYKNEGTTAEPSYSSWEHLKTSAGDISVLGG